MYEKFQLSTSIKSFPNILLSVNVFIGYLFFLKHSLPRMILPQHSTQLVELYLAHNILQLAHVVRRIILQKTRIRCELLLHERNRVTADVDIDSHPGLNPILGYAKVPLLPLVKACAPLNHIIHDSPAYVQLALYETPKIPPIGLTVDESASIRLYTIEWNKPHRSLYSMLNYALKTDDREDLQP